MPTAHKLHTDQPSASRRQSMHTHCTLHAAHTHAHAHALHAARCTLHTHMHTCTLYTHTRALTRSGLVRASCGSATTGAPARRGPNVSQTQSTKQGEVVCATLSPGRRGKARCIQRQRLSTPASGGGRGGCS